MAEWNQEKWDEEVSDIVETTCIENVGIENYFTAGVEEIERYSHDPWFHRMGKQ